MDEKILTEEQNAEQPMTEENTDGPAQNERSASSESEIQALQKQVEELKDKYVRLVADFDNFRKRSARERIELIQTASKDVISELLPVLDDSERAEKQMQSTQDIEALKEGQKLVFNKLRTTLQSKGLKSMDSVGTEFNPEFHEAITEVAVPDEKQKGKVIDEVEKGYYLNDKIIRFAKVVVGK